MQAVGCCPVQSVQVGKRRGRCWWIVFLDHSAPILEEEVEGARGQEVRLKEGLVVVFFIQCTVTEAERGRAAPDQSWRLSVCTQRQVDGLVLVWLPSRASTARGGVH